MVQSPSAVILEPPKIVCHCFPCFPINLPRSGGTECHDLKGGVICLSEVIDTLPAILIPACASSSPGFLMMYSARKLNKQGDNIQP